METAIMGCIGTTTRFRSFMPRGKFRAQGFASGQCKRRDSGMPSALERNYIAFGVARGMRSCKDGVM